MASQQSFLQLPSDLSQGSHAEHTIDQTLLGSQSVDTGQQQQLSVSSLSPAAIPSSSLVSISTINSTANSAPSINGSQLVEQPGSGSVNDIQTYIVFFDSVVGSDHANVQARVDAVLGSLNANLKAKEVYRYLNGFSIKLTSQQANRLHALSGVKSVEADTQVHLVDPVKANPNTIDPITGISALTSYSDKFITGTSETVPWGVQAVWSGTIGYSSSPGKGKYAFVIDTGISSLTNDLNVSTQYAYNWINNSPIAEDDNGHGTHVAGTIGALANGYGVVGVAAGATVIPYKVFDSSGSGPLSNVISAINQALGLTMNSLGFNNVVVNLSLGVKSTYSSLDTAITNAAGQGLTFSIAAGNSGADADLFTPARTGTNGKVYTVSAVDSNYKMQRWSNWDKVTFTDTVDSVDYAMPGVNVMSLSKDYGYAAYMSGTSMAAPHMAGLLLVGGVISGGNVTPYYSGTADPFGIHA